MDVSTTIGTTCIVVGVCVWLYGKRCDRIWEMRRSKPEKKTGEGKESPAWSDPGTTAKEAIREALTPNLRMYFGVYLERARAREAEVLTPELLGLFDTSASILIAAVTGEEDPAVRAHAHVNVEKLQALGGLEQQAVFAALDEIDARARETVRRAITSYFEMMRRKFATGEPSHAGREVDLAALADWREGALQTLDRAQSMRKLLRRTPARGGKTSKPLQPAGRGGKPWTT